jgi:hypothetical protein
MATMKRLWWIVGGVVVVGGLVILGLVLAPKSPIPQSVKKSVTSTLLVPQGAGTVVDRESANFVPDEKVLIYNVAYAGTKIIVSEQPTPQQFVDIPEVYKKTVDSMGMYQTFDVNVGTVYLTKSAKLDSKQAAVLNAKGTLLFAKPSADLSDEQWRVFFNHFVVIN